MRYFDLQVNGYAGVDFNSDSLDADEVERVCLRLEAQDVEGSADAEKLMRGNPQIALGQALSC